MQGKAHSQGSQVLRAKQAVRARQEGKECRERPAGQGRQAERAKTLLRRQAGRASRQAGRADRAKQEKAVRKEEKERQGKAVPSRANEDQVGQGRTRQVGMKRKAVRERKGGGARKSRQEKEGMATQAGREGMHTDGQGRGMQGSRQARQ
jgi:hypothetical protein